MTYSPCLTPAQLDRRLRWAELWLRWLAGLVLSLAPDAPRRPLRGWRALAAWAWARLPCEHWVRAELRDWGRFIALLVVLKAGFAARLPKEDRRPSRPRCARPGFVPRRRTDGLVRALIGARLRRRLRGRDLAGHIAALFAALRDAAVLVAAVARRIERRLTRLSPIIIAAPESEPARRLAAPAVCAADSS